MYRWMTSGLRSGPNSNDILLHVSQCPGSQDTGRSQTEAVRVSPALESVWPQGCSLSRTGTVCVQGPPLNKGP